jgi:hypothetical protein
VAGHGQAESNNIANFWEQFECPKCGTLCGVHGTIQRRWGHMDFFQYRCELVANAFRTCPSKRLWIVADIVRVKDGILFEHWDVIRDEATKERSKIGNPMSGTSFPS